MNNSTETFFVWTLPSEMIIQISKFISISEYHRWMLINRRMFQKLSSDDCYLNIYWKQVNFHCNNGEHNKKLYNPVYCEYHFNVHPLYSTYGNVSLNFRQNLLNFKKELLQNLNRYPFLPIEELLKVENKFKSNEYSTTVGISVVGNSSSGKSGLIGRIYNGTFLEVHYSILNPSVQYEKLSFVFQDFSGDVACDRIRKSVYAKTDTQLVLLCFSLLERESFEAIHTKWIHEIRHNFKEIPIILVGCKCDLRDAVFQTPELAPQFRKGIVTSDEAEELARSFGFITYWETSAKRGNGMEHSLEILKQGFLFEKFKDTKKKCLLQ